MKKFCSLLIASILLSACNSPEKPKKNWEEEVQKIDHEIESLRKQKTTDLKQANEEERQSLLYMRDDWSKYSDKVQDVEKKHKEEIDIDEKIDQLKKQRTEIINANEEKR